MKILFVVCGEGLGHASRCLHLGRYLEKQGHEIHFASYGRSYDFLFKQDPLILHRTRREVCLEGQMGFFSLKKTLWCSKWIVFDMLLSVIRVSQLIRKHQFSCVVCDTMYGGVLAARLRKTPGIFITNQNHFNGPQNSTNPVWQVLNFLIGRYIHLADHVIIPDYPAPDTISEYNIVIPRGEEKRYTFTGPFYDFNPLSYIRTRESIFTSFGGEAYKLPMYQKLKTIADRRKDLFFDVFYTGPDLPDSSDNFVSHGYVPDLLEHLARAKIAIVHGGLTTLHEAMLFEKPVLIIMDPNHPEQQNNAKKVVDIGAGTSVDGKHATLDELEKKIGETMTCCPLPFHITNISINGRKNAAEIILGLANRRQP